MTARSQRKTSGTVPLAQEPADERATVLSQQSAAAGESAFVTFERIRASELFDAGPLFAVVRSRPDFRFEYANGAFKKLVKRSHVLGESAESLLPQAFGEGFLELLKSACDTGETFVGTDVEMRIARPNSKPIIRYVDLVYKPLRGSDRRVDYILCYGEDVTRAHLGRVRDESSAAARKTAIDPDAEERLSKLSARERQVLRLLAAGGTSKSIARELRISPRTVEMYRNRLNAKLGVRSTAAAIKIAALGGI